jgi:hypothetical protein
MSRHVGTVLVRRDGALLGVLPAVDLACPCRPEAADVVAAVSEQLGLDVVVPRLLDAARVTTRSGCCSSMSRARNRGIALLRFGSNLSQLPQACQNSPWPRPANLTSLDSALLGPLLCS